MDFRGLLTATECTLIPVDRLLEGQLQLAMPNAPAL